MNRQKKVRSAVMHFEKSGLSEQVLNSYKHTLCSKLQSESDFMAIGYAASFDVVVLVFFHHALVATYNSRAEVTFGIFISKLILCIH